MARNLHIYPAPILNESRIFKETAALEQARMFDDIEIVGHPVEGRPDVERLSHSRRIVRIHAAGQSKGRGGALGKLVWFAAWTSRAYLTYRRSDVTCVNAHSVAVLPLAWFIARSNDAMLVYDTHELETETPSMRGLKRRVMRLVEAQFIRRCDLVITVNQSIADWYREAYGHAEPLIVRNVPEVIPEPNQERDLRSKLGVPDDRLLFVHTGNLGAGRSIPAIISTFRAPDIRHHVVFIGDGPMLDRVREATNACSRIHQLPPVPHHEVVEWIAGADVGLCLIEHLSLSYELSLPNKLFETIKAGIPVVWTYLREAHNVFGDEYFGFLLDDVERDLPDLVRTLTRADLERVDSKKLAGAVPSWETESRAMVAAYRELIDARTG